MPPRRGLPNTVTTRALRSHTYTHTHTHSNPASSPLSSPPPSPAPKVKKKGKEKRRRIRKRSPPLLSLPPDIEDLILQHLHAQEDWASLATYARTYRQGYEAVGSKLYDHVVITRENVRGVFRGLAEPLSWLRARAVTAGYGGRPRRPKKRGLIRSLQGQEASEEPQPLLLPYNHDDAREWDDDNEDWMGLDPQMAAATATLLDPMGILLWPEVEAPSESDTESNTPGTIISSTPQGNKHTRAGADHHGMCMYSYMYTPTAITDARKRHLLSFIRSLTTTSIPSLSHSSWILSLARSTHHAIPLPLNRLVLGSAVCRLFGDWNSRHHFSPPHPFLRALNIMLGPGPREVCVDYASSFKQADYTRTRMMLTQDEVNTNTPAGVPGMDPDELQGGEVEWVGYQRERAMELDELWHPFYQVSNSEVIHYLTEGWTDVQEFTVHNVRLQDLPILAGHRDDGASAGDKNDNRDRDEDGDQIMGASEPQPEQGTTETRPRPRPRPGTRTRYTFRYSRRNFDPEADRGGDVDKVLHAAIAFVRRVDMAQVESVEYVNIEGAPSAQEIYDEAPEILKHKPMTMEDVLNWHSAEELQARWRHRAGYYDAMIYEELYDTSDSEDTKEDGETILSKMIISNRDDALSCRCCNKW